MTALDDTSQERLRSTRGHHPRFRAHCRRLDLQPRYLEDSEEASRVLGRPLVSHLLLHSSSAAGPHRMERQWLASALQ